MSRDRLVELHDYARLRYQITWNRLQRPNYPAGYTKRDVRALKKALGVPKSGALVVSHTPQSEDATVWPNAGGVKNHHVVHSAGKNEVGIFCRIRGRMVPLTYPCEAMVDLANELGQVPPEDLTAAPPTAT